MKKFVLTFLGLVFVVVAAGVLYLNSLRTQFQMSRDEEPVRVVDASSLRELSLGKVVGYERGQTQVWLKIPFAQPPTEDLRWKAPKPAQGWEGTLEALEDSPICPQLAAPYMFPDKAGEVVGQEDCLYLNVFAPKRASLGIDDESKRIPVMVWIHGGGNREGAAYQYSRYAHKLVSSYNVIVVTVSYRLGPLGWFSHPALHDENATLAEQSGNFGTLDLIESLRWVKREIGAFGGDSNNVTIFGESAGGRNVFSLILSPLAKGLFDKAIAQSANLQKGFSVTQSQNFVDEEVPGVTGSSKEIILRLIKNDEKVKTRREAKEILLSQSDQQTREYLKSKSIEELMKPMRIESGYGRLTLPNNIMDGVVIESEDPLKLFKEGRYNQVPFIAGSNRDEQKLFMAMDPDYVWRFFGIPFVRDEEKYHREASYASDLWKSHGVDLPLSAMAEEGHTVYGYRFDWDDGSNGALIKLGDLMGAGHALEIPFVFNAYDIRDTLIPGLYSEENRAGVRVLSNAMSSYWVHFAYTGNPGQGFLNEQPKWEAWSVGEGSKYLIFDTHSDGGIRMGTQTFTPEDIKQRMIKDVEKIGGKRHCANCITNVL